MYLVGLDIGTTSISALRADEKGTVHQIAGRVNDAGGKEGQNPMRILELCKELLEEVAADGPLVQGIGVTGQMHGIVYLDANGSPVSPLYSWQDQKGNALYQEGETYAQYLQKETGYAMASGFGLTTHFVLTKKGEIPENAVVFCTIPDYIALALTGENIPVLHPSMAASLGLYDVKRGCFEKALIERLGMDTGFLPRVGEDREEGRVGLYRGTIPVAYALGDNQAAFLGSVGDGGNVLLNVGTGGQVSCFVEEYTKAEGLETRPYMGKSCILVGASLCGGYAYHILHKFFVQTAEFLGVEAPSDLYERMNAAALSGLEGTVFDTRFNGSRSVPQSTAGWQGLTPELFSPETLCKSLLTGMVTELFRFYETAKPHLKNTSFLAASGNGVRRNQTLRNVCEKEFQLPLVIPCHAEEAAFGGALFAGWVTGVYDSLEALSACIQYADTECVQSS